jgi:hypothetical protein
VPEAKHVLALPTAPATPPPPPPPPPPVERKHGTEVILYSPGFSVTVKGDTSVDHALSEAERIFKELAPNGPQSGSTGFAATERTPGFQAPGSSMWHPPTVTG